MHATTICCVRKGKQVVIAGDGQVSLGQTIVKHSAKKVRTMSSGSILAGFAGSTADAMTLFERFEAKLDEHSGSLTRAAVAFAKDWRSDRVLRRLEAMMIVADDQRTLIMSGNGDVLEPDEGVAAIGSGGAFAQAAAIALLRHSSKDTKTIAIEAMKIAASICVYTNENITFEMLGDPKK